MKCSSLKINGSEFIIQPGNIPVIASSGNCSSGFNMDSVSVTLQNPLPPGNYYLVIKNGDDGNTLLDNCDNSIPVNDSLAFTVQPLQPTMLDSIVPVDCSPNSVTLIFKKNIECNTIAADGSDFKVSGNTPVTVIGAKGFNCTNGKSNIIIVTFSKPIQTKGDYTLKILNGVDGNTIIDECGQQTPPASIHFYTKDTVNADFSYSFIKGCDYDSFSGTNAGGNEINEWLWNFDKDGSSTQSTVHFNFYNYGQKRISLFVSNGVCTDSAFVVLNLDNELKAIFSVQDEICPEDGAMFKDTSIGNILSWHWNFGDGTFSSLQNPPVKNYAPSPTRDGKYYTVSLVVQNELNCFDTATHTIKVLYTCYIAVPTAFTPNGDGINDFSLPAECV